MGNFISKTFLRFLLTHPEMRVLMVGLDGAGKTTMLYKMKLGEVVQSIPTIGFNVESVAYKNVTLNVWDVGGQDRIRPLWQYYFANTQAVIFVVDASDVDRISEARDTLHNMMRHEHLADAVLLVYANKQDLPNALNTAQLSERLQLRALRHRSHVQPSCVPACEGIYEGLEWVVKATAN